MHFLMTNDVETTSLELNRPADFMAEKVKNTGLPRLLELYSKYDVEATFFFTGHIVELMPELVDVVKNHGHEIACHGYRHEDRYAFDNLPLDKQIYYLKKAKKVIEDAAGGKIYSFRAPELRMNLDTIKALEITGFKYDSSVAPQRFDGPLSRGFIKKLPWLIAPRRPYYMSKEKLACEGDSKIKEIPITSFISSFMGTTMRISPTINRIIEKIAFREAGIRNIPVVFLIHPTEAIDLDWALIKDSANNNDGLFSGAVRKKLKYKNVGHKAIQLTEVILKDAKKEGFEFISISRYGAIERRDA